MNKTDLNEIAEKIANIVKETILKELIPCGLLHTPPKKTVKLEAWQNADGMIAEREPGKGNGFPSAYYGEDWKLIGYIEREVEVEDDPKVAREFRLEVGGYSTSAFSWDENNLNELKHNETIHAIEVLPGSVQVTRKQLAKAWDTVAPGDDASKTSVAFREFCRALGLGES